MNSVQRLGVLAALAISTTMVGPAPVSATSNQISGIGVFDTSGTTCPGPPDGYADFVSYPPIMLTGSLEGCWCTKIDSV